MTAPSTATLPPAEHLLRVASQLPVLHLQVQIQMQQAGIFDHNAGALFHGSLGWALREVAPELWEQAYGELAQQESRPFSILPPAQPCQWQAGASVVFTFIALASMALQPALLIQTFIRMGERGLGTQQIGFRLQQVIQQTPDGQVLLWLPPLSIATVQTAVPVLTRAIEQANALMATVSDTAVGIRVQCHSRLRLKEQGQVLRRAPTALQLARAVCRRLCTVQPVSAAEKDALYQLLSPLAQIVLLQDQTRQDELQRYSRQQQQQHPIEGLSGWWLYGGEALPALLPWLAIGQWLQLGGKTSFGFGAIEWQLVVLATVGGDHQQLSQTKQ